MRTALIGLYRSVEILLDSGTATKHFTHIARTISASSKRPSLQKRTYDHSLLPQVDSLQRSDRDPASFAKLTGIAS